MSSIRPEILTPLRRVLEWLLSLRDSRGRIICPEHGVEHSGKNAGVIALALELLRLDPAADREALKQVAVEQGRHLVANLEREGTSDCFTFRPGRHDPYNCSNSVIDGGACSDVLGQLVCELGSELDATDRERFTHASLVHARTYLRFAALDKGVPAQRAWGLTGIASAWRLENDPELLEAALEAVRRIEKVQHSDGSYPYHPLEWGAGHIGASDVSAFYQSRITGFLLYALEELGRDPTEEPFADPLRRGLDFLCALHGPGGIKCGLVEAKPWYWGANHEVASHPFDVHALATGWRVFGEERYADAAAAAHRSWVAHLSAEGAPRSHLPGPGRSASYQCPVFWAGHAMWLARAAGDLERILSRNVEPIGITSTIVECFADASLVRLENEQLVAWVRGSRPGFNVAHGSPHGAGLVEVRRKRDGESLLSRCRLGGHQEGEWSGRAGGFRFGRGWASGKKELRFSTWLARVHWRAGRYVDAFAEPLRTFRRGILAFAAPRVSSAFALAPELELLENGVRLRSSLAWRDGTPVPGTSLTRTFILDDEGLHVGEHLSEAKDVRGLDYSVPAHASRPKREARDVSFTLI
jgi:hypothetical protein